MLPIPDILDMPILDILIAMAINICIKPKNDPSKKNTM